MTLSVSLIRHSNQKHLKLVLAYTLFIRQFLKSQTNNKNKISDKNGILLQQSFQPKAPNHQWNTNNKWVYDLQFKITKRSAIHTSLVEYE